MKRRGTVYILVLGISVAVFTLATGSLAVVRAQSRAAEEQSDASQARGYALSALEIGRLLIANDADWRTNRSNGKWINSQAIGTGTFTLNVQNPNGALNNSIFDPVILTATGVKGVAQQQIQLTLQTVVQPYTCLQAAICANQTATLASAYIQNSGLLVSNSNINASSSLVTGAIEATGSISGGNYLHTTTTGVTARTMPDSTVFDYYTLNGTAINFSSLPTPSGVRTLDRRLLTPTSNPFGSANAMGIYVINCGGNRIIIQNCRILGTLVLLNVGANSIMQGAMVCAPGIANYPSLMVQGAFSISVGGTLTETGSPNVNFNPAGAPYSGVTNSNSTDSYATDLTGLYYVSGAMTLANNPVVNGVMVCRGTLAVSSTLVATYNSTFANNPPPGFGLPPKMLPASGSWAQSVN